MTRNPATEHLLNTLKANPRLDGIALDIAMAAEDFAAHMAQLLGDGPEFSSGLRKLREAKDCFVIQALVDSGQLT